MEKDMKQADTTASQSDTIASDSATIIVKETPIMAHSQHTGIPESDEVNIKPKKNFPGSTRSRTSASTRVVTADSVQAEEVPTIPIGSLETINALEPEVSVHSVASTRSVHMPAPLVVPSAEYRRSPGEWLQV